MTERDSASELPFKREPTLAETLPLKNWSPEIQQLVFKVDEKASARSYKRKLTITAALSLENLGEEGANFAAYLYGVKVEAITPLLKRDTKDFEDEDLQIIAELDVTEQATVEPSTISQDDQERPYRPFIQAMLMYPGFYELVLPIIRQGQLPKHRSAVEQDKERIRQGPFQFSEDDIALYATWNIGIAASQEQKTPVKKDRRVPINRITVNLPNNKKQVTTETIRLAQQAQTLNEKGLSIKEIAEKMGKHFSTVSRYLQLNQHLVNINQEPSDQS